MIDMETKSTGYLGNIEITNFWGSLKGTHGYEICPPDKRDPILVAYCGGFRVGQVVKIKGEKCPDSILSDMVIRQIYCREKQQCAVEVVPCPGRNHAERFKTRNFDINLIEPVLFGGFKYFLKQIPHPFLESEVEDLTGRMPWHWQYAFGGYEKVREAAYRSIESHLK